MAIKSKSINKVALTERDKNALLAVYNVGIIAAGHLVRLFWGKMSYGYRRLRMLANAGYFGTDAYKEPVPGIRSAVKSPAFTISKNPV